MSVRGFLSGITELLKAFRAYERQNAGVADGFHIRLWGSGSGEVIRDFPNGEALVFAFSSPSELWVWLHADPETRGLMQRRSLKRMGKEDRRLKDFIMEDASKKVQ